MEAEFAIVVPWGLKLSGRVLSCARGVGWPRGGGVLLPWAAEHPQPHHIPYGAQPRWGWAVGCRSGGCQTAARGTSRRGKMSPSETIKLLNKTHCLCECSMFFSICLGSATLTSWPYRGAAEGMRLIVQETSALANFSALMKPGQELMPFLCRKILPCPFPLPFLQPLTITA